MFSNFDCGTVKLSLKNKFALVVGTKAGRNTSELFVLFFALFSPGELPPLIEAGVVHSFDVKRLKARKAKSEAEGNKFVLLVLTYKAERNRVTDQPPTARRAGVRQRNTKDGRFYP